MIDIENYDENNIFAKILKKEIPSHKVYEDEYTFAFKDISPQAPIHILIIPKKPFCSFDDLLEDTNDTFLLGFIKSIKKVREALKIKDGYRLITNVGAQGGQEVPHLHFHLLSGEFSKRLVSD
jgi:histidine triad (HIT) family protein